MYMHMYTVYTCSSTLLLVQEEMVQKFALLQEAFTEVKGGMTFRKDF